MEGPPEEVLPKDFGKYRLERRLATGGMAGIFLASTKDGGGKKLVIKRILPHLIENAEFVSMFLDEARIAAQLKHENVVEIFDIGQIDGAYFIAMEYIWGEDIRRIYNRAYKLQRSLPISHSIRIVGEAAKGLNYAHKLPDLTGRPMGIVHRDVSPQNIIVTYEGAVKVVDFGIAKAINKVSETRAGVVKGKYSYMSPEQALGDMIDHRTDIFALGTILYEITTGTRLFKRHNELATLQAVIKCEVIPPTEALPGYPVELEEIVLKALQKDPSDRFQNADNFSEELFNFLYSSGLFVERTEVAHFMADLFDQDEEAAPRPIPPDEAAEKEITGTVQIDTQTSHPALVDGHRARTEQRGDTILITDQDRAESQKIENRPVSERKPGFVEDSAFSSAEGTLPEAEPRKRDATHEPRLIDRTQNSNTQEDRPKRPKPETIPPDQAPTVAAQPVYHAPPVEPEKPERESVVVERTEQVRSVVKEKTKRARPSRAPDAQPQVQIETGQPNRNLLMALIVIGAVILFAILVWRITIPEPTPDAEAQAPAPAPAPIAQEDPAPAPSLAEAPRTGRLRLAIAPWAEVEIDGEKKGMTPLPDLELSEGEHEVVLTNPQIKRMHSTRVLVRADDTEELKVDLRTTGERM